MEDENPENDETDETDEDTEVPEYEGISNKKVFYIIFAVAVVAVILLLLNQLRPITFAVYDPNKVDFYLNNMNEVQSKYNAESERIPYFLRLIFGNERINATLIRLDGKRVNIAAETNNGKISNIWKGEMKNPTMQLEIREATMRKISESDNAVDALEKAIKSGEIKYGTKRVLSKVKMGTLGGVIKVWSLVS